DRRGRPRGSPGLPLRPDPGPREPGDARGGDRERTALHQGDARRAAGALRRVRARAAVRSRAGGGDATPAGAGHGRSRALSRASLAMRPGHGLLVFLAVLTAAGAGAEEAATPIHDGIVTATGGHGPPDPGPFLRPLDDSDREMKQLVEAYFERTPCGVSPMGACEEALQILVGG